MYKKKKVNRIVSNPRNCKLVAIGHWANSTLLTNAVVIHVARVRAVVLIGAVRVIGAAFPAVVVAEVIRAAVVGVRLSRGVDPVAAIVVGVTFACKSGAVVDGQMYGNTHVETLNASRTAQKTCHTHRSSHPGE